MSNAREKVECSSNCKLYVTEEDNLQIWNEVYSGCGFDIYSAQLMEITQKINSAQLAEITEQIKKIREKTDRFSFVGSGRLSVCIN